MDYWILMNLKYLSEGSDISDNLGQTPMTAKYRKTFLNIMSGEIQEVTDLQSKLYRRDRNIGAFYNVYAKYYLDKTVSLLSAVVNQSEYRSISKFVNTISRKLKRKGIERLGYIWTRDIGDIKFEKHYHIILASSRIDGSVFHQLFKKKKHSHYDIEFLKYETGMISYLKEKSLYGCKKQRTYGKSRQFPLPNKKLKRVIYNNVNEYTLISQ